MNFLPVYAQQKQLLNAIFLFTLVCIACCVTATAAAFSLPLKCSADTVPENITTNINRQDTLSALYDTPSSYPGGQNGWLRYIVQNMKFSTGAIEGQAVVTFTVDEKGRLSNVTAISGSEESKREAIRLIKHSGRWIPATLNGSAVTSQRVQRITFHQEGN